MKTRLMILFVLVAGLAFALTWGVAAQGPGLPDSGRANGTIARKVQQDKHLALDRTRVTQAPLGDSGTFAAMTEGKVPQWNMRTPSTFPSARWNSAFSFDSVKGHFVLFGGALYSRGSDETWIYDGTTWTELTPTHKPPVRALEGNGSAYDPIRQRVVLFGGFGSDNHEIGDTWEFDGTDWIQVTPGNSPSPRNTHGMVYRASTGRIILFGGWGIAGPYYNDTWEYDGTTWTKIATANSPSPRGNFGIAYDVARDRVVVYGGCVSTIACSSTVDDTWEFDGTNWYQVDTPSSPGARAHHRMVYDVSRQRIVMFGGCSTLQYHHQCVGNLFDDTWEYDGTTWTRVNTSSSPPGRYEHMLGYDSLRKETILFGGRKTGSGDVLLADTWSYSGTNAPTPVPPTPTWTPTPTPTPPPPSGKQPIVFVHGWNGLPPWGPCDWVVPNTYFKSVDDALRAAGYYVAYAYLETSPCYTPSLTENVWRLQNAIALAKAATGQSKVILIAHSMGGLVSRAYIEGTDYAGDVSALFTFGSPHLGVPVDALVFLANGVSLSKYCETQRAVCDFTEIGMSLFNRNHPIRASGVMYHVISGDAPFFSRNLKGKLMDPLIPGPDDGIIPTISGTGLFGTVDRGQTDEVHGDVFGSRSYFIRDGGTSISYSQCLKRVLIDKADVCSAITAGQTTSVLTPSLAVHVPLESSTLLPGQTVTRTIELGNGAALFAAQWQTGTLTTTLVAADGQSIDPAFAASHPADVSYEVDSTSASYYFTSTVAGAWQLVLQAGNVPAEGSVYTTFAAFDSVVAVAGGTDHTWYLPGAAAIITASLSGSPASAVVTATVLRSDGVTDTVNLSQVGTGQYEGSYTVPDAPGYTEVRLVASGTTTSNAPFERGTSLTFQIASSAAALGGSYADRAEDSDGDGQYEALAVDVGVTANVSGTFSVAADLVWPGDGTVVARTAASAVLVTGTHTVTLHFDGDDIRASGLDGPYRVTSVLLMDGRGATLPVQEATDVWTTAAYKWADFGTQQYRIYLPLVVKG